MREVLMSEVDVGTMPMNSIVAKCWFFFAITFKRIYGSCGVMLGERLKMWGIFFEQKNKIKSRSCCEAPAIFFPPKFIFLLKIKQSKSWYQLPELKGRGSVYPWITLRFFWVMCEFHLVGLIKDYPLLKATFHNPFKAVVFMLNAKTCFVKSVESRLFHMICSNTF